MSAATYNQEMRLIPIYCDVCGRPDLAIETAIAAGLTDCPQCGHPRARTVPGASYSAEDRQLFNELAAALREAGMAPAGAAQVASDLGFPLEERGTGSGLQRLTKAIPSLALLEALVDRTPVE